LDFFHQSRVDSHGFRGVPQSKAAGLTLAGDWTSRKTTTSPQAAAAQKTQNRMSTITAASGAAQPQKPANCGLLGRLPEISRLERMRGGAGRTRTSNQTVVNSPVWRSGLGPDHMGLSLHDTARTRLRPELARLRDLAALRALLWPRAKRVCEAILADLRIVRRQGVSGVVLEIFSRDQQVMGLLLPDAGPAQLLGFRRSHHDVRGRCQGLGSPGAPAWRSIAPLNSQNASGLRGVSTRHPARLDRPLRAGCSSVSTCPH
jgi:hypothetical protein